MTTQMLGGIPKLILALTHRRAMKSLRWMSIAVAVDTDVLMDEDYKLMVFVSSSDAIEDVINNAEVDGPDG